MYMLPGNVHQIISRGGNRDLAQIANEERELKIPSDMLPPQRKRAFPLESARGSV